MTDKQPDSATHSADSAEQFCKSNPIGWIYEDDEGRITFSQMPQNPPFWEPVYRAKNA